MYRLLIVDDEPYVVDWIASLFEFNSQFDLDVCRAYTAFEALDWLNRAKIDIMVTDICMPGMNGITLMEHVKASWPKCRVILLTAHARFDYAYEAIKNNVVGFILKTEQDVRIISEVQKALEGLEKEYRDLALLNEAQKQLRESMAAIRKSFFLHMLQNVCREDEIRNYFKRLDIRLNPAQPFYLLMGRMDPDQTDIVGKFDRLVSLEHIAGQNLSPYVTAYGLEYTHSKTVWIMQPIKITDDRAKPEGQGNQPDSPVPFLKGALEIIQKICGETMGIGISFVVSSSPVKLEHLTDKFRHMEQRMDFMGYEKESFIMTDSAVMENEDEVQVGKAEDIHVPPYIQPGMVEKLQGLLENGYQREFTQELQQVTYRLGSAKSRNSGQALEAYYSLALMFMAFINQRKLTYNLPFKIGTNRLLRADLHDSWQEAVEYLFSLTEAIFDCRKNEKYQLSNDLMEYIRHYVCENITGDVSLVKLSEVTGYNPSYISRLYKEITGENLNDYIGRKRMEKAEELMRNAGANINDIYRKAGFQSRTYFNRFIKKMTGMSPSTYRSRLLEK